MAVTSNTYTVGGSGQAGPYSYGFPIIAATDIRVSVDGQVKTVTTHYTVDTANTRITFVSGQEPATGAKVIVYRSTDEDPINATFVSGSTIRSNELNDNFKQLLYIAQETENQALSTLSGTMVNNLTLGQGSAVVFEGSTDDANETTLTVADPTADRTITIPNVTGTVVTTGDTGTITSTMIANATVDTANLQSGAVTGAKIANDTIFSAQIGANAIGSSELADNAVDRNAILNDAVNGTKIADDSIDSEHYVDGSIDNAHIANGAVNHDKLTTDSVIEAKILNGAVTANKIGADAVNGTKIADNSIDSEHYVDGSIDNAHLANDAVNGSNISDNSIDSEHYVDGSIDTAHLANGSVNHDKLTTDSVIEAKIANNAVTADKIAANAVGTSEIADAELVTLAGMPGATASVLASSTALTSTTAELNLLDGKSFSTSVGGSSTDVQIPSAKAVNDQILAVTNALGGFVAIADELNFPNANPDPSDGAGTVVSIGDAGGVVVNGSGVATIANGTVGNSTVTVNGFPSSLYSKTLAAGVGLQVQTTSTLNTYTYHKLLAKEADVEQLSGDINDFNERYRIASSAPSSNNDEGDLWYDTSADKMKVYDGSAWGDVASTGSFYIVTLSSYSGTGGNSGTFNGSAYRFVLSNTPTTSQQLLVSINGVIQKPNSGTSQPSEGFAVDGSSILFSTAPASGSNSFIVLIGASVSVGTPSNNTVSEAILQTNAVSEEKLKVSNAPTNGYYLSAQSGASGGLTWAAVSQYSTPLTTRGDILFRDASGDQRLAKGTDGQFLKIGANDPVWADVQGAVADNCIYENDQTISNNYTIASGKGAHSVGPITVNATVTVNGNWVVS